MTAPPTPERIKKLLPSLADLPKEAEAQAQTEKQLREELRALKAKLATVPVETRIERQSFIEPAHLKAIQDGIKLCQDVFGQLESAGQEIRAFYKELNALNGKSFNLPPSPQRAAIVAPVHRVKPVATDSAPLNNSRTAAEGDLKGGKLKVLTAIAQYPEGVSRTSLNVLTGYRATSLYEYTRALVAGGFAVIEGDNLKPTPEGIEALGSNFQPLPTGRALLEHWRNQLTGGEKIIFEIIVEAFPNAIGRNEIMEKSGFKSTSVYEYARQLIARKIVYNSFGNYLLSKQFME